MWSSPPSSGRRNEGVPVRRPGAERACNHRIQGAQFVKWEHSGKLGALLMLVGSFWLLRALDPSMERPVWGAVGISLLGVLFYALGSRIDR